MGELQRRHQSYTNLNGMTHERSRRRHFQDTIFRRHQQTTAAGSGVRATNASGINYNAGNVGVGTQSPISPLTIQA